MLRSCTVAINGTFISGMDWIVGISFREYLFGFRSFNDVNVVNPFIV